MTRRLGFVLLALLCMGATPKEGGGKGDSDFWSDIAQPGRKQYQAALRKGRELFETAIRLRMPSTRLRTLEEALAAFRLAIKHNPAGAEAYFWLGKTAYALDRFKDAIAAFTAMRRLQISSGDELSVCEKLGIAYSKIGRYEESVQEYNRADRLVINDASRVTHRAVWHANAAESLMAMGRLEEAIQRYEEAVGLQPANILGWWGVAVAADRDGQASKAKEAVQRALALDPNMAKPTDDGVFFVPEGDIHYYFALGYEVKNDPTRAKHEWESFLARLGKSPWAVRARQHLADLEAAPASPKAKRLAPFPKTQNSSSEAESLASEQNAARYRIQGYLYRVRQCYQSELKKHPGLAGHLRLGITIGKDGRPQEVKVLSSTVKRPSLHSCVITTVKTIVFNRPASGGSIKVSFPMEFKPVVQ